MNQLEIEVKFHVTGFDAIRDELRTWGHCIQPLVLESNVCLDDANQRLRNPWYWKAMFVWMTPISGSEMKAACCACGKTRATP